MTGSHSGTKKLLRLEKRHLDVAAHLEDCQVLLQQAVHADETELAFAGFEREPHVVDLDRARAVQHSRWHPEHSLHCEDEVGSSIDDSLHRSRSGTVSNPIARSSAWPARKSVFSANWAPISCSPTGRPSDRPQGIDRP